jgi:hypothetical protein
MADNRVVLSTPEDFFKCYMHYTMLYSLSVRGWGGERVCLRTGNQLHRTGSSLISCRVWLTTKVLLWANRVTCNNVTLSYICVSSALWRYTEILVLRPYLFNSGSRWRRMVRFIFMTMPSMNSQCALPWNIIIDLWIERGEPQNQLQHK